MISYWNQIVTMDNPSLPDTTDRKLLEMIWNKLAKLENKLDTIDELNKKMDKINLRLIEHDEKISILETQTEDLNRGVTFIETEYEAQKQVIDEIKTGMVSKDEFQKLESEVINQSNRMRRKNVIFYNIPEGSEGEEGCTAYMRKLVKKIDVEIEIEVAHRNPTFDPNAETT